MRALVSTFLLLSLSAIAAGADPAAAAEIRAMTYNIHWAEQTDARTGGWTGPLDLRRVADEMRRSGAQIVMVQEVHTYRIGSRIFSEAHELARLLGWTGGGVRRHVLTRGSRPVAVWCKRSTGTPVVKRINGRRGTCLAHGNAILSRRQLFQGRFIDLFRPDGNLNPGDLYGAFEGRGALRAAILVNGRPLWIATTHLALGPSTGTCQLRDLLPQLADLRPLLLAGDFNAQPATRTPRPRCDGVPPRPLDQPPAAGLRRGGPGGPTYPAHAPKRRIDHFFASPPLAIRNVRPLDNCYRGRCSSDHRPLVAQLRLPD